MAKNLSPRRKHLRLPGYDYAQPGLYYVTIVTQDRQLLFGDVTDGAVGLSSAGDMVDRYWRELLCKFEHVELDTHVIMPNHLHGLLALADDGGGHAGPPLPKIIGWFKTMTTNAYLRIVKAGDLPPFNRRLWQRGYYEHVVRDEEDWSRIREYIESNPLHWDEDEENRRAGT